MKRALMVVCGVAVLGLLLAGCGDKKEETGGWTKVTSKDGGFSVLMPKQPTKSSQEVNTKAGPTTLHMYMVEYPSMAYAVMYNSVPGTIADPEESLDRARDGAVKSFGGVLVTDRKITLEGNPGREVRVKGGKDMMITFRHYVVGNKLYQLMVSYPEGYDASDQVKKFMNSFELI